MANGQKDSVVDLKYGKSAQLLLGSAKSITVPMLGYNGLQLNCDYTFGASTALVFTFTVNEPDDGNDYQVKKVDISAGTIATFSLTYTIAASQKFSFTVPITGNNVKVTVTGTGAPTNADILVIYPHALILS